MQREKKKTVKALSMLEKYKSEWSIFPGKNPKNLFSHNIINYITLKL